ncbi:hypothetical protein CEP51_000970 [Fusarium floridanum]|uniref:Helicase ATP-binding domain-containing protein n=1 Tax=Fusarium floridanum TaxID=1325733 RepID=A0A428SJB5_9HYPO|nr:hypothetical protein CEP51_000970 [Fusarium floridanum]
MTPRVASEPTQTNTSRGMSFSFGNPSTHSKPPSRFFAKITIFFSKITISQYEEQELDTAILRNGRRRKVPRCSSDRISLDDIIFVGNPEIADGTLVAYSLKNDDVSALKFDFLVVDEAHIAKNFDGGYNNVVRRLKTGTHLSSSLQDMISPLSPMWRATGI